MSAHRWATFVLAAIVLTGCTRVVVNKNPSERDRGIRYYRPKPYLFITPGTTTSSESAAAFTTTCKTIQNSDLKMQLDDAQAKGIVRTQATPVDYEVSSEELPLAPIPGGMERATMEKAADDPPPGAKVSITMMYMPDFAEEYSIRLMPGLGIGELSLKLDDGWNLTSVGMKTDQPGRRNHQEHGRLDWRGRRSPRWFARSCLSTRRRCEK